MFLFVIYEVKYLYSAQSRSVHYVKWLTFCISGHCIIHLSQSAERVLLGTTDEKFLSQKTTVFQNKVQKIVYFQIYPFASYGQTVVDKLMKTHDNAHAY